MDLGIKGKTALVLSAGGGLGRAISLALAREGANIAMTDIDAESLQKTAAAVEGNGVRAISGTADLLDAAALEALVARVDQEVGGVDILVNMSGGPPPTKAAGVAAEQWTKQFQAMVVSMIHAADVVLPNMRAKKWGRIITSTSSGVIVPIPNLGISNSLRSALIGWSKTLATEVAADGITANIIVPGRIATGRTRQLDEARAKREGKTVEEVVALSTSSIPMHRYGDPEEYANVVTFLASQKASYITGSIIRVDGGMIPAV